MSTSSIVALAVMLAGVGPQLTNTPMHAGSPSANDRLAAVKSGAAPMNGVNLGSWLVLEKWMAPAPWDGISGEPWGERQLMLTAAQQGKTAQVRQAIKQHRDSWVKEEDFITMEAAGINAVRLPVGFWVVAGTAGEAVPFVEGGLAYVDKAMEWGAKHGIGVLLDMHAAPGSQNGFDHSAPAQKNKALWDSANQPSPSYPAQTLAVIKTLAQRYGSAPALLGFAPLNEPTVRKRARPCLCAQVIGTIVGAALGPKAVPRAARGWTLDEPSTVSSKAETIDRMVVPAAEGKCQSIHVQLLRAIRSTLASCGRIMRTHTPPFALLRRTASSPSRLAIGSRMAQNGRTSWQPHPTPRSSRICTGATPGCLLREHQSSSGYLLRLVASSGAAALSNCLPS